MIIGLGLIRLALALTVVITHSHSIFGFTLGNPVIAVRTFFIISGFYMSLILNEKYKSKTVFWYNRILRIFPIYWAVLLLTILSCIGAFLLKGNWGELSDLVKYFGRLDLVSQLLIIISHFTILGREIVMFSNFKNLGNLSGQSFLLIPQAWTLVLELWFYILAPFVLTRKFIVVFTLLVASVVIKYVASELGFSGDLWLYRFFPSELVYFLMGWFSYRIYKLTLNFRNYKIIGIISTVLILLILSVFNYINYEINIREWIFYLLLAILIPLSFNSSKNSKTDRLVGDLSYPVYISHILIINIINPLIILPFSVDINFKAITVFIFTVVFSFLLIKFIQNPIDKIREAKVKI